MTQVRSHPRYLWGLPEPSFCNYRRGFIHGNIKKTDQPKQIDGESLAHTKHIKYTYLNPIYHSDYQHSTLLLSISVATNL